jgi:hypothetical protein
LTHGSNQPKGSQAIKRDSKKRIKKKRIEKRISEHRQGRGIYNTSFLNRFIVIAPRRMPFLWTCRMYYYEYDQKELSRRPAPHRCAHK